jgi:hypothetical protein
MAFGDRIKAMVALKHSNISSSGLIGVTGKLAQNFFFHPNAEHYLKLKCTGWQFSYQTT